MVFSNITTRITVARTVDLLANHKFWMSSHDLQRFNRNFLSDSIAIFDDEIARFDCDLSPFLMVRSQFFMIPSAFFIMFHNSIPVFPWSTPNKNHISRAFFNRRPRHQPRAAAIPLTPRQRPAQGVARAGPSARQVGQQQPKDLRVTLRGQLQRCHSWKAPKVSLVFFFGEQKW